MANRKLIWGAVIIVSLVILFTFSVYIARMLLGTQKRFVAGGGVGIVEVKGVIIDADEPIRQLKELMDDNNVKAIVLRIDSPGGVVGPAQEIYEEVRRATIRKKVVVSMGSVAASGGYYIAAPATCIIANPGTITGSIGVILKFSNIEGLLSKIGMKAVTVKSGKNKDVGSPVRPMTPEDRALMQGVIDNIHAQFVKAVADGRKLPPDEVRRLADGRIYTGEQALALKLIDKLGNQQDAIAEAAKLAGIKGEPSIIKPARKKLNIWDMLVGETESRLGLGLRNKSGFSANYEMDGPGLLLGGE